VSETKKEGILHKGEQLTMTKRELILPNRGEVIETKREGILHKGKRVTEAKNIVKSRRSDWDKWDGILSKEGGVTEPMG